METGFGIQVVRQFRGAVYRGAAERVKEKQMPNKPPQHNAAQVEANQAAWRRHYEGGTQRRAAKSFYASAPWKKFRRWWLMTHPMCADCGDCAEMTGHGAAHVHHIKPREQFPDLAFDASNVKTLCRQCHSRLEANLRFGKTS